MNPSTVNRTEDHILDMGNFKTDLVLSDLSIKGTMKCDCLVQSVKCWKHSNCGGLRAVFQYKI